MGVQVTDKDLGWKTMQRIAGKTIQVKVQSVARNTTGKMYAYFVESGTRFKSGRPFVAPTLEDHNKYRQQMGKIMDRLLAGDDVDRVLDEFGEKVKNDIQRKIQEECLIGETGKLQREVRHAHKIGAGRFKRGTWT